MSLGGSIVGLCILLLFYSRGKLTIGLVISYSWSFRVHRFHKAVSFAVFSKSGQLQTAAYNISDRPDTYHAGFPIAYHDDGRKSQLAARRLERQYFLVTASDLHTF
jgi:hypothetical protein